MQDREEWFKRLELRCARSWDYDLRAGTRTFLDVLKAYEARTHSSAFEPGTPEFQERVRQADYFRSRLARGEEALGQEDL